LLSRTKKVKESVNYVFIRYTPGGSTNCQRITGPNFGTILRKNFDHPFEEYKITQRIKRSHLAWSETQVMDELERQKRHYENELRVNLKVAALSTIEEIENLIRSLKHNIAEWKIKNL
jgi:hypothetical protein